MDAEHATRLERLAIAYWTVALSQSATVPFYARPARAPSRPRRSPRSRPRCPPPSRPDRTATSRRVRSRVENVDGLHWRRAGARRGGRASGSPRRSPTRTCSPTGRATPPQRRCRHCSTPGWTTTGIVTLSQLVSFLALPAPRRRGPHRPEGIRPMTDHVLQHTFEAPNAFTQAQLGWEALARAARRRRADRAALRGPGRQGPGEQPVLPAARARPRDPRRPHPHRQRHLLQREGRPAPSAARARGGGRLPHERLHLLRLGALPLRRALLEARRTTCSACSTRAPRRSRTTRSGER